MNIKELVPEKVESEINSPDHPTRRFVGFALLLAWHYNLWFLHDSFVGAQLLDDCVTQSWLIALVSAAVSFIGIAGHLGQETPLVRHPLNALDRYRRGGHLDACAHLVRVLVPHRPYRIRACRSGRHHERHPMDHVGRAVLAHEDVVLR